MRAVKSFLKGMIKRQCSKPKQRERRVQSTLCQNHPKKPNQQKRLNPNTLRKSLRQVRRKPQPNDFQVKPGDVDKGSISGRRLNFESYTAYCFRPYLFSDEVRGKYGCGASALALLTGALPEHIALKNNSPHYADRFMVAFLRQHGFAVQALTQSNIASASSAIEKNHVLLLSQLFRRQEATWGVIHNGWYYHNFELYFLNSLTLIRKPVVSAYLIGHTSWRNCSLVWEDHPSKHNIAASGLSLSALGLTGKKPRVSPRKEQCV